jgi:hypothetical protein
MQMKRCLDLTECNYSSRLICQRLNFRYRNSRLSLVLDSPEDRGMTGSATVRESVNLRIFAGKVRITAILISKC